MGGETVARRSQGIGAGFALSGGGNKDRKDNRDAKDAT
jgi:hypothetical protein